MLLHLAYHRPALGVYGQLVVECGKAMGKLCIDDGAADAGYFSQTHYGHVNLLLGLTA
jgi:hypothetical protein